ncbi:hypothetical protein TRFO_22067 [Tritrichomonas foetus]|uniref:Uncharacterized protein n=1 Tax=Tritrichomonas foetus TaxID=1144522 RepID=A0A1J4KCK1_9EUKA|nr:hypothetical protein TRFO_22067 [Tritrichomonas foetus]|eukprot:OHT09151.1 hypothetical protein TRFO_22067 [Tritrichomonas foetus]
MRGRLIREKDDAIPKGMIKKVSKYFRNAYNYLRTKSTLPSFFYLIRIVFVFYEYALPNYFPKDLDLWKEDRITTQIMHFASVFSYFGAVASGYSSVLVSYIVLAVIFFFVLMLNMTAALFYQSKGRMSNFLMQLILFCNDILIPIFASYSLAEIGLMIAQLIFVGIETPFIVGIFVLILLISLTLIVLFSFYFPEVIYNPESSVFWSGHDDFFVFVSIGIINMLARFSEAVPLKYNIYMRVIYLVFMTATYVYFRINYLFVKMQYNSIIRGILSGGLIIAIIQATGVVDQDVVFLFSIVIFIATVLIEFLVSGYVIRKTINKLDNLLDNPDEFPLYYKTLPSLIGSIRIGISVGHPYIASLSPFREGAQLFPNSKILWEHYLRFVAIYPEENLALMTALEEMKSRFRSSANLKTIRLIATTLLQSRNKHMSSPLKRKLKQFDEYSRLIRSIYISYWSAISEGSSIAAYDISKQLIIQRDELKSQYLHQLSLFPNNWILCSHFAKNLEALDNNQTEAEYWSNRAQAMRKSEQICDRCHIRGIQTFPNLPLELRGLEDNVNRPFFGGSIASRSSVSARSASSIGSVNEDSIIPDEQKSLTENIRVMGLKTKIPFVTNIIMFTIIIFLIFGVVYPFMPGIPYMMAISSIQHFWAMIEDSTGISYIAGRVHFLLGLEIGRIALPSMFPSIEKEWEILKPGNEPQYIASEVLHVLAENFSRYIDMLIRDIGRYYDNTKTVAESFFTTTIDVYYTGATEPVAVSIPDALSYTSAQLFGYHPENRTNYSDQAWYQFTMDNIISISDFLFAYARSLFQNSVDSIAKSLKISRNVVIVFDILLFLVSLFFYPLLNQLKKKWDIAIKALAKLPKSSIHQTVANFSASSANVKVSDEERLYNSEFMTMAISRDSQGGLPTNTIAILYGLLQVAMIVSSILVFFTSDSYTKSLTGVPMIYILLRQAEVQVTYTQSLVNLYKASLNNVNIVSLNSTELFNKINDMRKPLQTAIDEFVIGSADGANYGMMSATNPTIVRYIFEVGNLLEDNLSFHQYMKNLPDMIFLNTLYQLIDETIISYMVNDSKNSADEVLILNHLIEQHIDDVYDKRYAPPYKRVMETYINKSIMSIVLYPLVLIAIEIILIVIIINMLNQVRLTTRFVLSTLSFIDSSVVTQSQELSNLLAGQFYADDKGRSTSRIVINSVPDFSSEVIVLIGKDKRIHYIIGCPVM